MTHKTHADHAGRFATTNGYCRRINQSERATSDGCGNAAVLRGKQGEPNAAIVRLVGGGVKVLRRLSREYPNGRSATEET